MRGRGGGRGGRRAPSLRVLALADAVRLQLVVDEVVLGLAALAAVRAREPLVAVRLRVHVEHVLAQVGRGGVHAAAQRTLRPVAARARPARARQGRPCNTEAALDNTLRAPRGVGGGGGRAPLLHAVDGIHVDLHVLARLEGLAAQRAGVRQRARRVHVGDVLLEVAVVAVQLAARRARGLAAPAAAPAAPAARRPPAGPGRSWGRRNCFSTALPATLLYATNFHCCLSTRYVGAGACLK